MTIYFLIRKSSFYCHFIFSNPRYLLNTLLTSKRLVFYFHRVMCRYTLIYTKKHLNNIVGSHWYNNSLLELYNLYSKQSKLLMLQKNSLRKHALTVFCFCICTQLTGTFAKETYGQKNNLLVVLMFRVFLLISEKYLVKNTWKV